MILVQNIYYLSEVRRAVSSIMSVHRSSLLVALLTESLASSSVVLVPEALAPVEAPSHACPHTYASVWGGADEGHNAG